MKHAQHLHIVKLAGLSDMLEGLKSRTNAGVKDPALMALVGALLGGGFGAATADEGHALRGGLTGGAIGGLTGAGAATAINGAQHGWGKELGGTPSLDEYLNKRWVGEDSPDVYGHVGRLGGAFTGSLVSHATPVMKGKAGVVEKLLAGLTGAGIGYSSGGFAGDHLDYLSKFGPGSQR